MNKCVICGKECGKGKTCSPTCRSRLARSVAKGVAKPDDATVGPVSVAVESGPRQPVGSCITMVEWQACLNQLLAGVVRPLLPPDDKSDNLTAQQIRMTLAPMGQGWQTTQEYAQLIWMLTSFTVEELEQWGYDIPAWKRAQATSATPERHVMH